MAVDLCAAGRKPHGGWVEYDFPSRGDAGGAQGERCFAAQGTPYVVVAGIYDPTVAIGVLDKLTGE